MLDRDRYIDKHIGNYRVVSQLHSNSPISKMYQAERLDLKHAFVALKIFHSIHLPPQRREQFLQEVQLHKRLRHVHLLPLLDAGLADDIPYLVTDYIASNSLRDRLRLQAGHILPLQEAVAILTQVGQALYYAHLRNVVHAHLKPENILLREGREVLVTDFTIASVTDALSSEGAYPANAYPYMAPEQFRGWINKSSDQYALGCIAYEMLTGSVPFSAPTFALMEHKHTTERPVAPTQQNLLLPIALEQVILKAMEKKSAGRYPTIQDFVTALRPSTSIIGGKSLSIALDPATRPTVLTPPVPTIGSSNLPGDSRSKLARFSGIPRADRSPLALNAAVPAASPASQSQDPKSVPANSTLTRLEDVKGHSQAEESGHVLATSASTLADQPTAALPGSAITPPNPSEHSQPDLPESARIILNASVDEPPAAQPQVIAVKSLVPPLSIDRQSQPLVLPLPVQRQQMLKPAWLIIVGSWLIVIVIITALLYTTFAGSFSAKPAPTVTVHKQTRPTVTPATLPLPTPTPTRIQLPVLAGRVTPMPTPTPTSSASPSPTPGTVFSATPANLPTDTDCHHRGRTYTCSITLQLSQSQANSLNWFAYSSNLLAFVSPSNGTLFPGQQQSIYIKVASSCPVTGALIFSTSQGNLSVPWSC